MAKAVRRFDILRPWDDLPTNVLRWQSTRERNVVLRNWRDAVFREFNSSGHCATVAWLLRDLMAQSGYCFASDPELAVMTGMPRNRVQDALGKLAKEGAIVRLQKPNGEKPTGEKQFLRLIYPAKTPFTPHPKSGLGG